MLDRRAPGEWSQLRPVGQLVRGHRVAAGLTQAELAEQAGVSPRAISDLERGLHARPHPATLQRLAAALGLDEVQSRQLVAASRETWHNAHAGTLPTQTGRRVASHLPLTSFVGRRRELKELRDLLQATRLLTLAGPGGVGKTRLATALVQSSGAEDELPCAFADLSPLADPTLVPRAVAVAVGLTEQPGRASSDHSWL